jgi:hypothetical protein
VRPAGTTRHSRNEPRLPSSCPDGQTASRTDGRSWGAMGGGADAQTRMLRSLGRSVRSSKREGVVVSGRGTKLPVAKQFGTQKGDQAKER